ncbi:MAG: hypothetical protein AB7S26_30585 [Sandaracinaceae bacterium]
MGLTDLILGNYKRVADRLGLVIEDGRIHGVLEGVPIQVWFGPHATHIVAMLPRPAQVDVSVATKGLIAKLADLFGSHRDGIGDPAFDKVFAVKASDLTRAAGLLDPAARNALLASEDAGQHPAVDAHSVHLRRFSQGGWGDSEQMIDGDFHAAVRLAKVIGDSFGAHYR